jgi:integrase
MGAATTPKRVVLTDRYLRSLKPAAPGKRTTHWDAATPSFGCRVTDRGVISFFVMRRRPGKPQPVRVGLGAYPGVTLATARKRASAALGDLMAGIHPREREREERLAAAKMKATTFAGLADRYLERRASERRSAKEIGLIVRRYLLPWSTRAVTEIRRTDVLELVEGVRARSGLHAARQALTYASAILGYGCATGYGGLEANPCALVKAGTVLGAFKPRQRVLTDAEIGKIWAAADTYPAGTFIRLLILTGARRAEVADMTWDEVDLDRGLWTLAGDRTKNGEPEEKALSGMTIDLLRSLPRFTAGPYVLTSSAGVRAFQAFTAIKDLIDDRVPGLGDWRIHDIRRTMRTGLARVGVSPFTAELCIGHTQKGVHAIYDVHSYGAEKRDAMERWASKVRSIVEPPPENVVNLVAR